MEFPPLLLWRILAPSMEVISSFYGVPPLSCSVPALLPWRSLLLLWRSPLVSSPPFVGNLIFSRRREIFLPPVLLPPSVATLVSFTELRHFPPSIRKSLYHVAPISTFCVPSRTSPTSPSRLRPFPIHPASSYPSAAFFLIAPPHTSRQALEFSASSPPVVFCFPCLVFLCVPPSPPHLSRLFFRT